MILSEVFLNNGIRRCNICEHFVKNSDCLTCNLEFPSNELGDSDEVLHLSIMTHGFWVKVGCCCHLSINMVSKEYRCMKISNGKKTKPLLSESIIENVVDNVDELFQKHIFPETGGHLDGFDYRYIIQKGNEMFRQCIDCDEIEFWPLLDNLVKELMVEEDFINIHP